MNKYILKVNPKRKRFTDAHYTDTDFVLGYDIDNDDFAEILSKRKQGIDLSHAEQDRLGYYLGAIVNLTFRSNKATGSTRGCGYKSTQDEYCDAIFTWLMLHSLDKYDPTKLNAQGKPSKPYSFFVKASSFAVISYWSNKKKERTKHEAIQQHCQDVYDYVVNEVSKQGFNM